MIDLKVIKIYESIEQFMKSEQFKKEIDEPATRYHNQVYKICIADLTDEQRVIFDDWWFNRRSIPSDRCYWDKTSVPDGYKHLTPYDIKRVHDSILTAASMGCG